MARKNRFDDVDTRVQPVITPTSPEPTKILGRRRNYAHDFSGARELKLIINSKGQPKWRRVPDGAVVFYGKVNSKRRTKTTNPMGKKIFITKTVKPKSV